MEFGNLTDENFIIYATKAYDNPNCIISEFEQDLKKIKYIKKLFRKYKKNKDLKERLILNHLIILYNVFGNYTTRMLFFKLEEEYYGILKTFLVFLNYMPKIVYGINGKNILSSDIQLDDGIIKKLREI